jgi:Skp family chaperone for outer membrane proteins
MKKRYILIWLFVLALILASGVAVAQKTQNAALAEPVVVSPADKAAINTFEKQVKGYIALRNKVRENAPKLSKDSTAEQIHAYRTTLEQSLRNARANAKRGEFFRPETADFIRRTLKIEFQGKDRKELREQIFETEIQGVVLRVNYPYAQTAEFSEMPATLLAKLPKLPKELRYRFVGRNMLLVDRESDLIIDFMPEALP